MGNRLERDIYIIAVLFLLSHVFIFTKVGVVTILESEKYIRQADLLLNGQFPGASKYYYYLPIILLIALVKKASLSFIWVAFAQSLISLFATIAFYRGTKTAFGRDTAFLSTLLLTIFFPLYSWDFHLYSDSIFISLSLFLYYAVCKFEYQSVKRLLAIFLILVTLIFTRPFGVLFIPPLFLYFLLIKYKDGKTKVFTLLFSAGFLIFMALIIEAILHGGEDMDAMKPFVEEHVICFVPNSPQEAKLHLKYYDNGLRDIFYYITHNPEHFTKLMLRRLYSFFKLTRPWFTRMHNVYLLSFLIPVYLFFIPGLFSILKIKKKVGIYIIGLLILYPVAMTFQCDDWHGRFTMPVVPPIFVVAVCGFIRVKSLLMRKQPI